MKAILFGALLVFQLATSSAFASYFDPSEASCQPQTEQTQSQQDMNLLRACTWSSDCFPDENCIGGQCVLRGGGGNCLGDNDCPIGEHCLAGRCIR